MRRRILIVLACATVIGLLTSVLVYSVVHRMATASAGEGNELIVVAAANMNMAETVTPAHVKMVAFPKSAIPAGAIKSVDAAKGRVVKTTIVAGEPLLDAKLAPELSGKGGIMPMLVPEGHRGVSIKVDDAVKESGFVLPNSRVDVLVSLVKDRSSQVRFSRVILQDVLVLAAGQSVELQDNKPVTVTTVTLSLTPEQAERLAVAQAEGKLTLATRNLRDKGQVQTAGVSSQDLISDRRLVEPQVRPAPVARASAPVKAARPPLPVPDVESHSVSVVRGGKISEQVFVKQEGERWVEQGGKK